jgi:hypothetical protein
VTDRLWEMTDLVEMIEAFEAMHAPRPNRERFPLIRSAASRLSTN